MSRGQSTTRGGRPGSYQAWSVGDLERTAADPGRAVRWKLGVRSRLLQLVNHLATLFGWSFPMARRVSPASAPSGRAAVGDMGELAGDGPQDAYPLLPARWSWGRSGRPLLLGLFAVCVFAVHSHADGGSPTRYAYTQWLLRHQGSVRAEEQVRDPILDRLNDFASTIRRGASLDPGELAAWIEEASATGRWVVSRQQGVIVQSSGRIEDHRPELGITIVEVEHSTLFQSSPDSVTIYPKGQIAVASRGRVLPDWVPGVGDSAWRPTTDPERSVWREETPAVTRAAILIRAEGLVSVAAVLEIGDPHFVKTWIAEFRCSAEGGAVGPAIRAFGSDVPAAGFVLLRMLAFTELEPGTGAGPTAVHSGLPKVFIDRRVSPPVSSTVPPRDLPSGLFSWADTRTSPDTSTESARSGSGFMVAGFGFLLLAGFCAILGSRATLTSGVLR